MLLLHQVGSVKIGEVVRYTVTYTPSQDRILPSPERLHLRIRNTSAIALRAAFVHGPYTLSVAAYPSHFDPNVKFANARRYGVPEFEPMLKAGGTWECELVVPENIRQSAGSGASGGNGHHFFGGGPERESESASWIIEVSSQVIFSTSAAVNYELVLARDEKSLNLSYAVPVVGSQAQVPQPGKVSDFQASSGGSNSNQQPGAKDRLQQPRGVFSRAIRLKVEDTASLWNSPPLPAWDDGGCKKATKPRRGSRVPAEGRGSGEAAGLEEEPRASKDAERKPKKVHLVVITHGLHSNLGADMLFMKESIDKAVAQANVDRKARKAKEKEKRQADAQSERNRVKNEGEGDEEGKTGGEVTDENGEEKNDDNDDDDELVIVRGFSGNATRTERGIKYLGKRLARYVLSMTYPDQPYLPVVSKGTAESVAQALKTSDGATDSKPVHKHSTVHKERVEDKNRAYRITSISFIAHSLGGLVQAYAVAYIQKHSPQFFDVIEPVNFIGLATPFLGLSNENPLYVKFALDFGLVGRTGKDLGLTWRAPTIARSGWGALVGNLGESAHKRVMGDAQPESKPLLRILPTGPAHVALKKFRNRTVYSNVVNDGIVPLRTSCLLFLDWQGLERVEKARRDAGLVETIVGAGWAELTGANLTGAGGHRLRQLPLDDESVLLGSGATTPALTDGGSQPLDSHEVPQPSQNATLEDDRQSLRSAATFHDAAASTGATPDESAEGVLSANPFAGFFSLFKSTEPPKPVVISPKQTKVFRRSQTLSSMDTASTSAATTSTGTTGTTATSTASQKSRVTTGSELDDLDGADGFAAPPRTTFFESASDLINPKLPSVEYLIDPSRRHRTIFHDRVYHPADIPAPPLKRRPTGSLTETIRRKTFTRTPSTNSAATATAPNDPPSSGGSVNGLPARVNTQASDASSPFPSPGVVHEDSMHSTRDYDDLANHPPRDPHDVVDSAAMRVEEKIARAYHRDLSWRKVLVKLEPDAHNNIIVRRMFANAFGWPVVKHLVDAHFSDSATARMRDDDESSRERARDIDQPPDEHGSETSGLKAASQRTLPSAQDEKDPGDLTPPAVPHVERTDSETIEARDMVPDLPPTTPQIDSEGKTIANSEAGHLHSRPPHHRLDSVTWSERDWEDTDIDSDADEAHSHGRPDTSGSSSKDHQPGASSSLTVETASKGKDLQPPQRSASPLSAGWNWAEKIVGKGATSRSKSKSPDSVREAAIDPKDTKGKKAEDVD